MAITYSAARESYAPSRQVFNASATHGVVIKTDSAVGTQDVIAVAPDFTTAQSIVTALNGGV